MSQTVSSLTTIVVSRNKSCHVKTLHSLLRLNLCCMHKNVSQNIVFVNDDPFDRAETIMKYLKATDKLLFIDYSVYIDNESLEKLFMNFDGFHCLVLPCVKEGINWEKFKTNKTDEPCSQVALEFDTQLGQKISDSLYRVTSTEPRCWIAECKHVLRCLRERKGESLKIPAKNAEIFKRFIERGVKICAYTACKLTVTYPHECLSNILESAGVKSQ